jgi:hypothetical protein
MHVLLFVSVVLDLFPVNYDAVALAASLAAADGKARQRKRQKWRKVSCIFSVLSHLKVLHNCVVRLIQLHEACLHSAFQISEGNISSARNANFASIPGESSVKRSATDLRTMPTAK